MYKLFCIFLVQSSPQIGRCFSDGNVLLRSVIERLEGNLAMMSAPILTGSSSTVEVREVSTQTLSLSLANHRSVHFAAAHPPFPLTNSDFLQSNTGHINDLISVYFFADVFSYRRFFAESFIIGFHIKF